MFLSAITSKIQHRLKKQKQNIHLTLVLSNNMMPLIVSTYDKD